MLRRSSRRTFLLSGATLAATAWLSDPAQALFRTGVASGTTQLTTMTLVNTSGAAQAANFVTPVFGMTFPDGIITPGTAPSFTISGTPQLFSWGLQSYWPSGYLRHASFMFLCGSSIAGSGTLAVVVNSGGTAPAPSSRTLTEVYAQNLQVGGPGIGAFGFLTGTWNGYLTNDANNTEQFVYMDGQAGKVWRIKTHMAQTQGGTAHGQLEVYHYITALQDIGGNLGGFRHIARITQPYYNHDTPTKNLRAFSSVTWQYGAGPTVNNLTWPFGNINFNGTNTSVTYTVASAGTHDLYQGAQAGSGTSYVNGVPGYLSATTDPALSTSQIYWAYTSGGGPSTTTFLLSKQCDGAAFIASQGGASTFVPLPTCLHFGSIWTADSQGRSNFFQGTGSMVADGTIRTQYNLAYLHSTGALPPWLLSLAGTVSDIPSITHDTQNYWSGSPQWSPPSFGPINIAGMGATGDSKDIGPLTSWHCAHAFNQSAVGDLAVRAMGFAGDFSAQESFRDFTTGQYPNVSNSTYTGMPAPSTLQKSGLCYVNGTALGSFTLPSNPTANSCLNLGGNEGICFTDHRPCMAYYAFLVFGEPHYHDKLLEGGLGVEMAFTPSNKVPTNPVGYGIVVGPSGNGLRAAAWAFRDLNLAATFCYKNPSTGLSVDGSQNVQYAQDLRDANISFSMNYFNSTYIGSYLASVGAYIKPYNLSSTPDTQLDASSMGFMADYWLSIMAWGATLGNSSCLTACNNYGSFFTNAISTYGSLYPFYGEYVHSVTIVPGANPTVYTHGGGISASNQLGLPLQTIVNSNLSTTSISYGPNSPCFAFVGGLTGYGYTPANGDTLILDPTEAIPGGFTADPTAYVILNLAFTGGIYHFDLAVATNPTVAITPTTYSTTIAATGSSYNSTTGLVTLNTTSAHGLTPGSNLLLNFVAGSGLSGSGLPTGSVQSFFTCGSGTTGTTITFTIATGLSIATITGGNVNPLNGFSSADLLGGSGPWIMPSAATIATAASGSIPTSTNGATGATAASSYLTWLLTGMNWSIAAGATTFGTSGNVSTPLGDAVTRLATKSPIYTANANWSSQSSL
jgi:hypothetical protein